jgi:hypothetical protein
MKKSILILMGAAIFGIMSCKNNESKEQNKEQEAGNAATTEAVDPDPTDSIPASGYAAYNSDLKVAELLKKTLAESVLKEDISTIPANERKFRYHAVDLNNDKIDEYLVAPPGNFYCGTGGCSFFIIDNNGKAIGDFTVSDFPIYTATSATEGWQDLIIRSNGKDHLIKMKNGKYPSNPSVAPEYKGEAPNTQALLDIYQKAYPAFSY